MTEMHRKPVTLGSFTRRTLVPGIVALAVLALAVLFLAVVEHLIGYEGGVAVLVATTLGGMCAVIALLAVAIVHVRLERAADYEAARSHAVMAAMTDGVVCTDEGARIVYMNAAAERLLSRHLEDCAGKSLATLFRLPHGDDERSPLLAGVVAHEPYAGRASVVCGDGGILSVDVRMAPILLQGRHAGTVLRFADDTERSREEQAKDDFVGFASHELRSPLTAMLGFASWLARKLEQEPWRFDADTAEAIAALTSETGRMESIIELFLDLTQIRMDRLDLAPDLVDLTKLLREEGAAVRSRYPAAIVEERLLATRMLAIVDEQRLRQVMLNLLDNAAKYGGTNPRIVLSLRAFDGTAEIRVKDSGSGIPHEDQSHIFERFFRSSAPATGRKKGFGIGLYVTKQLVDRMGGELSFASEEGTGTEFALRLPLMLEDLDLAEEREVALAH